MSNPVDAALDGRPDQLPPRRHLEHLVDRFDAATRHVGVHEAWMELAGLRVRLLVAGDGLAEFLLPSLRTVSVPTGRSGVTPSFTIRAFDSAESEVSIAPPPWGTDHYLARDEIVGSGADNIDAAYAIVHRVLTMFDAVDASGLWWAADHRSLPPWEQGAPFRNVLNWGLAANGLQMAHAAAVGLDSDGLLIVGRGGVGKSTSTLACVAAGWQYVADDYCALATSGTPTAYALFGVGKLDDRSQDRLPGAFEFIRNPHRPKGDKAIVDVARCYPQQLVNQLRLRAVVLPTLAGPPDGSGRSGGYVWPARPVEAGRALVPSTLLQLPGCHPETGATMSAAIAGLPVVHMTPGSDMQALPEMLAEVLADAVAGRLDEAATENESPR